MRNTIKKIRTLRMSLAAQISKLTDYLYLSGIHPLNHDSLHELGVTCVVDATNTPAHLTDHVPPDIEHVRVPVEDSPTELIHLYFEIVNNKVREHRFTSGRTLIHCHLGMSRSAALTLAYFMGVEQTPLKDAFRFLRSKRFVVRPNMGFWEQLIAYEKLHFDGKATVEMIKTKAGEYVPDILLQMRSETMNSMVVDKLKSQPPKGGGLSSIRQRLLKLSVTSTKSLNDTSTTSANNSPKQSRHTSLAGSSRQSSQSEAES